MNDLQGGGGRVGERLLRFGVDALSGRELLGLLFRDGMGEGPALDLAGRLMERFGGLRRTASRTVPELTSVPGIGPVRAAMVTAAFGLARALSEETLPLGARIRTSGDIYERFWPLLRDRTREMFISVLLDGKNRVLREDTVSVGSLTSSIVHPREVFAVAIRESADGVVFVHNHPSGDPAPSIEDVEITNRLLEVGRLVGIRVLDHVVIGDGGYVSFHERGLLPRE